MSTVEGGAVGRLAVLNVGSGHREITWRPDDEADRVRAAEIINGALRRGYAIFVHLGGSTVRVRRFLSEFHTYLIDEPEDEAARVEAAQAAPAPHKNRCARCGHATHRGRCRGTKLREVETAKVRATAVGRSAGG